MKAAKILIVEDDAFSRGAMEKLLQSYDYATLSCGRGDEAIAHLERNSFDILITDLHMPGMDGFELIRNARMIHPGVHTIMITGFPLDEIKSKVREERVDGFFSKPIVWPELYALLDTLSRSEKVQNPSMPGDIREGKRPFLGREILFGLLLFLFAILNVQALEAQPSFSKQNKPILRMGSQEACWQSPDLALTEEQTKALEALQHSYMAEAMPLRRELIPLRFELRHLIRDTNVQSKILFDRQKMISQLQAKLDNLSLSYQIKVRSIFTKEQLEQLPSDCLMGMEVGFEMGIGIGRGPRRGPRW